MLGVASIALRAAGCTWPPKTAVDPISHWDFDETSSAEGVFEDEGPAHVLMVHAETWADLTTGSLVEGVGGTSAYTDGAAYATMPADVAAHDLAALTISFYYQRNSASEKHILLAGGNGSQVGDFSIEVLPNGRLRGWHTGQDGVLRFFESTDGVTGTDLQVGTAHRIELTLGPQGARLYLDGAELTAAAIPENTNGWNNAREKYLGRWIDGVQAPAVGVFDRLRIWNRQLNAAEIAFLEPAISIDLPNSEPPPLGPGAFTCPAQTGTLVTTHKDLGTTTAQQIFEGGNNKKYNFTGSILTNSYNPGNNQYSPSYNIRNTNNINGGCMFGATIINGYALQHDGPNGAQRVYPANDGGQILLRNGDVRNFLIDSCRFDHNWDPIRMAAASQGLRENITIKKCWFTRTYDDVVENDSHADQINTEDCLVDGCFVFYSDRNSGGSVSSNINVINKCLVRMYRPYVTSYSNHDTGKPFKLNGRSVRYDVHDSVFFFVTYGSREGFRDLVTYNKLRESSGNRILWGGSGSYPGHVPPGFTVTHQGAAAHTEWANLRDAWLAANQHVPRIPGVDT